MRAVDPSSPAHPRTRAPTYKKTSGEPEVGPREHLESHWSDLNRRPLDYESSALPLSYSGDFLTMPWRGFEPRRLAAPPPQDGVSTSFTTRAMNCMLHGATVERFDGVRRDDARTPSTPPSLRTVQPSNRVTGPTGLEPATSRVTVECSNQTELRPLAQSGARVAHPLRHRIRSPASHPYTACHRGTPTPNQQTRKPANCPPSIGPSLRP